MERSEEIKALFDLLKDGVYKGVTVHQSEDSEFKTTYHIYTDTKSCIRVEKTYICGPSEHEDYEDVASDGFLYRYQDEAYEGFNACSLKECLRIMKNLTQPG